MFLAENPGQKTNIAGKKGKKMFLAEKPGQEQTLLAKKGKMFLAGKKPEHYGCWLPLKSGYFFPR